MIGAVLPWLEMAGALAGGLALGFFHFGTLARVSEGYLRGRAGHAVALHVLRMLVMIAVLVALARAGAAPLLAGALGVFSARAIVLRRARSAS